MKSSLNIAKKIAKLTEENSGKEKQIVKSLVEELESKNLTYLLPSILKSLKEIGDAQIKENTVLARVSHANLLSETKAREIAGAPQNAPVKMVLDERLLGGSVIRYRGRETNLSAEAQVQRLNKSFK